ncbi:hypothetical protein GCM10025864_13860 [Luteimicrobium album]|uniref:Response regulatory domain-containing protein n=1 Tax=Luteimicrobium album TaxID=1054550 RepID=A0ABQ6I061_9MICO|nr:hypothetical protein [Luteimicrobium album]GMA23627.1 hypothetical protein GCM10025864_13860 [Luteimicrobium album]
MTTSSTVARARVLVVGRSPSVLEGAVEALRADGFDADATNQFGRVLDDYDARAVDVLVFGGMVPADAKERLRDAFSDRNPKVTVVQGLAGIAGLIAAQVRAATSPGAPAVVYDPDARAVTFALDTAAHVVVEAWWAVSMTPPEPTSASLRVLDARLEAGAHTVPLPDDVPSVASFAAVMVGRSTAVLVVGPMPRAVTQLAPRTGADSSLPPVRAVSTGARVAD